MPKQIRNIAVIAHVDHGKTTLIDALLKQTHAFRDNQLEMATERLLDSNDQEKERGITITAKTCSIEYKNVKINIIDTPGHADFSGEVERTLSMADGALLIIDAQEGPMPQTRFVLKKALSLNLKIIVVVNKIDKKLARIEKTLSKTDDLFLELANNNDQLEFKTLFAVGRTGAVFASIPKNLNQSGNVTPLLDAIINFIPSPNTNVNLPPVLQVSSIEYNSHLGQILIGKLLQGQLTTGQKLFSSSQPGKSFTLEHLMVSQGLSKKEVDKAEAGDIVYISGASKIPIGATISTDPKTKPLPNIEITKPALHMTIGPNTSPFAGQEGGLGTSRQLEQRLNNELESNLSLKVDKLQSGKFKLSGRGELHLAVLLETLRREGFEMEVGNPQAIIIEENGVKLEPVEELSLITPSEFVGVINQTLGKRHAELVKMDPISDTETEFIFHLPTRNLIGLRSLLLTLTKGTILFNSHVLEYQPLGKPLAKLRSGTLISSTTGNILAYGLHGAQGRGDTFVAPGTKVYQGQIIGQNARGEDLEVNACKGKQLTNMRSKSSDGIIQLAPPITLSLEQSIDFLEEDELLEITPKSLRLRKKLLTDVERRRHRRAFTP
ncbi:GTP-binding protein [Patescibacteria group bacterium]|nr:GTP-binding protein [Patescibacteria group bacterium]